LTIFSDGFESGSFSAWTSTTGTCAIISSPIHHGTKASRFTNNGWYSRASKTGLSTANPMYVRAYFYLEDLPDTNSEEITLLSVGGDDFANPLRVMVVYTGGAIHWRLYNGYWGGSTDWGTPLINTWYCVEVKYTTTSSDTCELYINGVNVASQGFFYGISPTAISIGGFFNIGEDCVLNADCVVVADAYIGPEAAGGLSISVAMHHYNQMRRTRIAD